ncbi:OLC1v1029994C1 [Oldenlandia corymbosa var. corymbosa]|uniref:OLC1v1029994C1 n=1 Tax=Oldenlandia corymbosa var. corymbosa TaxID=529605 RepID=A0AAV1CFS9_OLDCO|nr:OLC1v1029994C1 [Oldenlandia corymbosa var. corymbosa]
MVRRRVEIKKIDDNNKRQVTFTKRRQGLFKKANELCKKCDCQIAVMAVSKAGNLFAFGNPTFDATVQRYLDVKAAEAAAGVPETKADVLHQQQEEPESEEDSESTDLEEDKSLALRLAPPQEKKEEEKKVEEETALWDIPVDEMGLDELQKLNARMEEVKKRIADRANDIIRIGGSVKN